MNDTAQLFVLAAVLALVAGVILAVWLIGAAVLQTMGLILVVAIGLAAVIAASALPIRAYRRRDMTGETHHYHDGTKTVVHETRVIDGRPAAQTDIKLLQLPAQPQAAAFPELLRASYQAGVFAQQGQPQPTPRADLTELDLTGDDWGGDITG
ncbi:MAG: hypothetical protein BWY52_01785 [Chloroflexi bacterium ADurb.Bin325]|nr:MAG: hypothetical protein BWY52_01785 [Chloroflexi bacterium ADurb.Bin325]